MDKSLTKAVRQRAGYRCEYCGLPQACSALPLQIEHIIARKHDGVTGLENLALACLRCNAHKGPNIAGIDPETGLLTRLFHPRADAWVEHFMWQGIRLTGLTPIGRTTIHVLVINDPEFLEHRQILLRSGGFPYPT